MENEKLNGEQPILDTTPAIEMEFDKTSDVEKTGSPLGKFKDVDALLGAYNALQSEFTKKCQQLSQLEKAKNDNVDTPFLEKEDWQEKFDDFFNKNPNAKQYSKQIAEALVSDNELQMSSSPLASAYVKILEKNYENLKSTTENESITISKLSKEAKEKVVDEYLKEYKNAPYLMTGQGGNVVGNISRGATTMSEAGEIAKKLFL